MQRHLLFLNRAGNINNLRLMAGEIGPPKPGEVLVKVSHSGLNLADVFACLGLYSATPKGGFTPGLEFAGIVEEIGPVPAKKSPKPAGLAKATGSAQTAKFKVGDAVWGFSRFGAYTSHINTDSRYIQKIPKGWSLAEAASFGVQALTAWYGLIELGQLKAGQTVLVQSAAGGVGLHALQILQSKKARAVAVVGRVSKASYLQERFGLAAADIVIRPVGRGAAKEFGRRLDEAAVGFDLILDAVAGDFFKPMFERLLPGGRYLLFGAADFMPHRSRPNWLRLAYQYMRRYKPDPLSMISDNRTLSGFNLIWLYDRVDEMQSMLTDMMQIKWQRPLIDSVFGADRAIEALEHLKSGRTKGKVLLDWNRI